VIARMFGNIRSSSFRYVRSEVKTRKPPAHRTATPMSLWPASIAKPTDTICLQLRGRNPAEGAPAEPTRPIGPGRSRLVQFLRGKSRRPGVATAIGQSPVAAISL